MRALLRSIYRNTWQLSRMRRRFPGAHFEGAVQWSSLGRVEVGRDVSIDRGIVIAGGNGSYLSIGPGVWIGRDCEIAAVGRVTVGNRTSLQHRTQLHGDVEIGTGP